MTSPSCACVKVYSCFLQLLTSRLSSPGLQAWAGDVMTRSRRSVQKNGVWSFVSISEEIRQLLLSLEVEHVGPLVQMV